MSNEEIQRNLMWKYALSRKLRKRINAIAILKLALKLDAKYHEWEHSCGTRYANGCPFYCRVHSEDEDKGNVRYCKNHLCLAPNNDSYWREMNKSIRFISPRYGDKVIGCYISIFIQRGFENYSRLRKWVRRVKRSH